MVLGIGVGIALIGPVRVFLFAPLAFGSGTSGSVVMQSTILPQ